METRDVINADGQVIGSLSLPDGTSESEWETKLNSYKEIPPIPDVTPRQIRQALVISGIPMSSIESALDSLPEPTKSLARIEWEYSIAFQRNRPLVIQMGAMLGFSKEQLDALWHLAATL